MFNFLEENPRSKDRKVGRWDNCLHCNNIFASYYRHNVWIKHCSRSCCNSVINAKKKTNNSLKSEKKRVRGYCSECNIELSVYKALRCKNCFTRGKTSDIEVRTIEEITSKTKGFSRHRYQKIRNYAKNKMKASGVSRKCKICGYSAYVEVCHVKPITSFPLGTKVSEVNSMKNLVYLCPNHHWELDNGIIPKEVVA